MYKHPNKVPKTFLKNISPKKPIILAITSTDDTTRQTNTLTITNLIPLDVNTSTLFEEVKGFKDKPVHRLGKVPRPGFMLHILQALY